MESHWCLREEAPRTETSIEASPRWCHRFEMRSLDEETVLHMEMAVAIDVSLTPAACSKRAPSRALPTRSRTEGAAPPLPRECRSAAPGTL